MRLASPSLPVYHEQIPMLRLKAICDSIKDVVLLRWFKVDVVKLVVVCFFSNAGGKDFVSGYSVAAIPSILLLFIVVCRLSWAWSASSCSHVQAFPSQLRFRR